MDLESLGFWVSGRFPSRSGSVTVYRKEPFKVVVTDRNGVTSWRVETYGNTLTEGNGMESLVSSLQTLSEPDNLAFDEFLGKLPAGEGYASLMESIRGGFAKALLEAGYNTPTKYKSNSMNTYLGRFAEATQGSLPSGMANDDRHKVNWPDRWNEIMSAVTFPLDAEGNFAPHEKLFFGKKSNPTEYTFKSNNGSDYAVYKTGNSTPLKKGNIGGSPGSTEWRTNIAKIMMDVANAQVNPAPSPAPAPTPEPQPTPQPDDTQVNPAPSPAPAPTPEPQAPFGLRDARDLFNRALDGYYCERENTQHPSNANELYLNVGLWIDDANKIAELRRNNRIVQHQGLSTIDVKEAGNELAVIFRGRNAEVFKRSGGLSEQGRWTKGKSQYNKLATLPVSTKEEAQASADKFRELAVAQMPLKTESDAGRTNAQAMAGTPSNAATNTAGQQASATREPVADNVSNNPRPATQGNVGQTPIANVQNFTPIQGSNRQTPLAQVASSHTHEDKMKATLEYSNSNFTVVRPWKEIFTPTQSQKHPQVGDIGELTKSYMDRAYAQRQTGKLTFDEIEKIQDIFVDPDMRNSSGDMSGKNRNLKRGEYNFDGIKARHDGQDGAARLKFVQSKQREITAKDLLQNIKNPDWTINTLSVAITEKPINWSTEKPKGWK